MSPEEENKNLSAIEISAKLEDLIQRLAFVENEVRFLRSAVEYSTPLLTKRVDRLESKVGLD